jgi:hypothetical protein
MLLVQVPLKVKPRVYDSFAGDALMGIGGLGGSGTGAGGGGFSKGAGLAMATGDSKQRGRRSDVEQAVLGHGKDLGAVGEGEQLTLERDPRFPVRVTVQLYKATSNGVISDDDLDAAQAAIDAVYASGDHVGSLVVPEGQRSRPTDWHLGTTSNARQVKTSTTTLPEPPTTTPPAVTAPLEPPPADAPAGCPVGTAGVGALIGAIVVFGLFRRRAQR